MDQDTLIQLLAMLSDKNWNGTADVINGRAGLLKNLASMSGGDILGGPRGVEPYSPKEYVSSPYIEDQQVRDQFGSNPLMAEAFDLIDQGKDPLSVAQVLQDEVGDEAKAKPFIDALNSYSKAKMGRQQFDVEEATKKAAFDQGEQSKVDTSYMTPYGSAKPRSLLDEHAPALQAALAGIGDDTELLDNSGNMGRRGKPIMETKRIEKNGPIEWINRNVFAPLGNGNYDTKRTVTTTKPGPNTPSSFDPHWQTKLENFGKQGARANLGMIADQLARIQRPSEADTNMQRRQQALMGLLFS